MRYTAMLVLMPAPLSNILQATHISEILSHAKKAIMAFILTDFRTGPFDMTVVVKLNGPEESLLSFEPFCAGAGTSHDVPLNDA